MSTEDNKHLVRRLFEEVLNQRKLALIHEFFSPNHVEHASTGPVHGPEGMKQYYLIFLTAFPDAHYTVEDQIAEGDKVVTRWTARGTHQGEVMGIPATGKQGTVTGIGIARIEGGKLVEAWTEFDALGMMQQLGVVHVNVMSIVSRALLAKLSHLLDKSSVRTVPPAFVNSAESESSRLPS